MPRPEHDLDRALQGLDAFLEWRFANADSRPPRTPLDMLHRYWRQVTPRDRLQFLTEMLTPNERRTLLLGFAGEEDEAEE